VHLEPLLIALTLISSSASYANQNMCERYGMVHGLFSMDTEGKNLKLIRNFSGPSAPIKLHISPDGKKIVYSRCTKDINNDCICDAKEYLNREVVVSDLNGGNELVIGKDEGGFNDYPNWSPNGDRISFIHSTNENPAATDIFTYDLEKKVLSQITNTPDIMETDHYWNTGDTITAVQQKILDGRPQEPNTIVSFSITNPPQIDILRQYTNSLGHHCCGADPKYSRDKKYFAYSEFTNIETIDQTKISNWQIKVIAKDGTQKEFGSNAQEDYWPMWNFDSQKLLWISFDPLKKIYSTHIKNIEDENPASEIRLIGDGIKFSSEEKTVVFGYIGWLDWFHPQKDQLIFPATYLRY
jgi:Tol biopolymer transport system component